MIFSHLPLGSLTLMGLTALAVFGAATPAAAKPQSTFTNPLKVHGADPWMTYYHGWYYLGTTTGSNVSLRRARHIADLKTAPDTVVWKDENHDRFQNVWAPEFHLLESGHGLRWYLYYTADDGKNGDQNHRIYVAESAGTDPLGPYTYKAQLQTDPKNAYYAIDATVLKLPNGTLYAIWCGRPSDHGQGLFIARMSNPWTITGERTALEASGFGCQWVREGPVTLLHDGRIFLIYSACSADTADYKLGMLEADLTADLLAPASWKQHPEPVFTRDDAHGIYGPGHNFFFRSPDGKEGWIVYHAKTSTNTTYADRTTRAQPFTWRPDGTPDFGRPLPIDTAIPVPSGEK